MTTKIVANARLLRNDRVRFEDAGQEPDHRYWISNPFVSLHPSEWAAMTGEKAIRVLAVSNAGFSQIKFEPEHFAHLTTFAALGYGSGLRDNQLERFVDCAGNLQHVTIRASSEPRAIRALVRLINNHTLVTLETDAEDHDQYNETLLSAAIRSPSLTELYLYNSAPPTALQWNDLMAGVDRSHCKTLSIAFDCHRAATIAPNGRVETKRTVARPRHGNVFYPAADLAPRDDDKDVTVVVEPPMDAEPADPLAKRRRTE